MIAISITSWISQSPRLHDTKLEASNDWGLMFSNIAQWDKEGLSAELPAGSLSESCWNVMGLSFLIYKVKEKKEVCVTGLEWDQVK